MSNNQSYTIIKVCSNDFQPTTEDLERWRIIFENAEANAEIINKATSSGEIKTISVDIQEADTQSITFIKLGDGSVQITPQDLETWRDLFIEAEKEAIKGNDFKIFSTHEVNIEQINFKDLQVLKVE